MHELLPFLPESINNSILSLSYFLPEIFLAILFIVVLVTDLLFGKSNRQLCRVVACAGILLIIHRDYQQIKLLDYTGEANGRFLFQQMLLLTRQSISYKLIIDALAFVLLLYFEWDNKLNAHQKGLSDLYAITIGSVFGLHLMVMAVNLLSIYLSIELVSISSYLMVAYRSESKFSTEAGLKYVLFGASASAVMLYGISLIYAFSGSLDLYSGHVVLGLMHDNPVAVTFAMLFLLTGIGFKLAFVPMHFWAPDIYQGAPTPVTAWLSTLPKIAGFALLLNFLKPFILAEDWKAFDFRYFFAIVGTITMIFGNFAAVLQKDVKRMLAYSSIGHTGFALMAVVTFTQAGLTALIFYLAVYGIANVGAFALTTYFSNTTDAREMTDFRGLGFKYPTASVCFVIILISLTGLPVSAGFNGKLLVFSAVYSFFQYNHNPLLLVLLITGAVTTVVSLFYYIKIPYNLFLKRSGWPQSDAPRRSNIIILSIIMCFLIILLGIFPNFLINYF